MGRAAQRGSSFRAVGGGVFRIAAASAVLVSLTACEMLGPKVIYAGRDRYNEAFQQTDKDQLLQNIVRLRYSEPALFLEISSISSSGSFDAGFGASASHNAVQSSFLDSSNFGGNASLNYSERPTVIYSPLRGEKFVTQLMTPVSLNVLALLLQAGWSLDRVFLLLVEEVNGIANASSGAGPTPEEPPTYEGFHSIVKLLHGLRHDGKLHLVFAPGADGRPQASLRIPGGLGRDPRGRELARLLRLDPSARAIAVTRSLQPGPHEISLVTRSLNAAAYYIGQSVEVPERDVEEGRVRVTRSRDGTRFDWSAVFGPLFRVHAKVGGTRPGGAYAAVRKGDTWFYIADDDVDAKRTFTLFTMVLALLSGDGPTGGPLLTLPISG